MKTKKSQKRPVILGGTFPQLFPSGTHPPEAEEHCVQPVANVRAIIIQTVENSKTIHQLRKVQLSA